MRVPPNTLRSFLAFLSKASQRDEELRLFMTEANSWSGMSVDDRTAACILFSGRGVGVAASVACHALGINGVSKPLKERGKEKAPKSAILIVGQTMAIVSVIDGAVWTKVGSTTPFPGVTLAFIATRSDLLATPEPFMSGMVKVGDDNKLLLAQPKDQAETELTDILNWIWEDYQKPLIITQ